MKTKLILSLLLVAVLAGCNANDIDGNSQDSIPTRAHPSIYTGPWQQSGIVTIVDATLFTVTFEDQSHTVRTLSLCTDNPNESMKDGHIVDIKYRLVNDYNTIYIPCYQIDSYKNFPAVAGPLTVVKK